MRRGGPVEKAAYGIPKALATANHCQCRGSEENYRHEEGDVSDKSADKSEENRGEDHDRVEVEIHRRNSKRKQGPAKGIVLTALELPYLAFIHAKC